MHSPIYSTLWMLEVGGARLIIALVTAAQVIKCKFSSFIPKPIWGYPIECLLRHFQLA